MKPLVTIISPIRNEEKYIESFLESIFSQDYPQDKLQIILVDGFSTDKTREIIEKYCATNKYLLLLDNPNKTVPYALNIGIRNAIGDIIIRLDAHAIYPHNYISALVHYLNKLNADNVGGVWETIPANDSLMAKSIAIAMSSPFGVGNATYRIAKNNNKEFIKVDTVPFGCYKKTVFEKYGMFDEQLTRNQDNEFNERIISGGGTIFLIPLIKIKYIARENYLKLFRMFYQYGYFGPLVDLKLKRFTRLRRYIPSIFVLSLIMPVLLAFFYKPFIYLLLFVGTLYFGISLIFSVYTSIKEHNIRLIPFLITAFFISHISYGLGYLAGFLDFYIRKKHTKNKLYVPLSR